MSFLAFTMMVLASAPSERADLPSAPPPVQPPRSGELSCELRELGGAEGVLSAVLGYVEPNKDGSRDPNMVATSSIFTNLNGEYAGYWSGSGARFLKVGRSLSDPTIEIQVLTVPFQSGSAALIAEISNYQDRTYRYFSGFCSTKIVPNWGFSQ